MLQGPEHAARGLRWRLYCRRWAWLLAALLAGEVAEATDGEPRPRVVVAFNPLEPASVSAGKAIQSHLSGLGVVVVLEPLREGGDLPRWLVQSSSLAVAHGALGAFTLDTSAAGDLLVFFTEPEGDAALIRRLRPKPPLDRVALEEAGNVVRSLVEALLEGGRVGIGAVAGAAPSARTETAAPGEPDAVSDPSEKRLPAQELVPNDALAPLPPSRHLGATLHYSGTSFAVGQDWQSGMALGLRSYAFQDWYVAASYGLFPKTTTRLGSARITLDRRPAQLAVGYEPLQTLAPSCELAFLADRVTRRTLATEEDFQGTPDEGRWLFGVGLRGGGCWSPWAPLHGCLIAGMDVLLGRLSYVVGSRDPKSYSVLRTFRPHVELGIGADFL